MNIGFSVGLNIAVNLGYENEQIDFTPMFPASFHVVKDGQCTMVNSAKFAEWLAKTCRINYIFNKDAIVMNDAIINLDTLQKISGVVYGMTVNVLLQQKTLYSREYSPDEFMDIICSLQK